MRNLFIAFRLDSTSWYLKSESITVDPDETLGSMDDVGMIKSSDASVGKERLLYDDA